MRERATELGGCCMIGPLTATNVAGLDANIYPGDDVLRDLVKLASYQWMGY
jgi:hypothetical protein